MSDAQQPTAEQYRKTAEEIRRAAQHIRSPEIRGQMLDLSERYERLAAHAGRRGFWPEVTNRPDFTHKRTNHELTRRDEAAR